VAAGSWTGPRTPDGQPDVSGHWSNTIGNHNTLEGRLSDPVGGVPYQPWAKARQEEFQAHLEDPTRPEYVEPLARCAPGGPTKSFLWHGYEIRQYPGYVLFLFDSGTRVIRLGDPVHLPAALKLWNGDSRGRWEGNTLVVDITGYNDQGTVATNVATQRVRAIPQSEQLHAVERFTRVDENTIDYEVTIEDPKVFTSPWKVAIPLHREPDYQLFEYACHEGNRAVPNTLSAGRAKDREARAASVR